MGLNFSSRPVGASASPENRHSRIFFFLTVPCSWLDGQHVVFGVYLFHTPHGPLLTHMI